MAKPIEPTPTVEGKDAEEFIKDILSPSITKKERDLFKEMLELEKKIKDK